MWKKLVENCSQQQQQRRRRRWWPPTSSTWLQLCSYLAKRAPPTLDYFWHNPTRTGVRRPVSWLAIHTSGHTHRLQNRQATTTSVFHPSPRHQLIRLAALQFSCMYACAYLTLHHITCIVPAVSWVLYSQPSNQPGIRAGKLASDGCINSPASHVHCESTRCQSLSLVLETQSLVSLVSEMTYTMSSGTLNSTIPYPGKSPFVKDWQSATHLCICALWSDADWCVTFSAIISLWFLQFYINYVILVITFLQL